MKITLEPTNLDMLSTKYPRAKVTVEYPFDNMNMNKILLELVIPALLATGYSKETVDKYIDVEDDY